jgi:hypothetical protein
MSRRFSSNTPLISIDRVVAWQHPPAEGVSAHQTRWSNHNRGTPARSRMAR